MLPPGISLLFVGILVFVHLRVVNPRRNTLAPCGSGHLPKGHKRLGRRQTQRASVSSSMLEPTCFSNDRPTAQHDDAMVVEAIERARAYSEAGADGLFAPGLVDITLIARLVELSPLPLNIMIGDATPPSRALAEHGVARLSHGPRSYLIAMKALEKAARVAST